jgi:hypothetical protein
MSEEQPDTRVRLEDFLASFVAQQVDMCEDEIVLKVTAEEFEALGEFFIQGIAGWMLGIQLGRSRSRPFVELTPASRPPDPEGDSSETKNGRSRI